MSNCNIILVGEARGRHEEQFSHGFVGESGKELARMLGDSGLTPQIQIPHPSELEMIAYWKYLNENLGIKITNVFEEHPPDNNLNHFFDTNYKDNFMPSFNHTKVTGHWVKPEHRHHITNLFDFIRNNSPNLVICLGNVPSWAILYQNQITKIRGTLQFSQHLNQKCLPTFHPSFILQGGWNSRHIVLADFKKASLEQHSNQIIFLVRKAWLNCTLDEIENWLNLPADDYTIDIESGYILYSKAEIDKMPKRLKYILSSQISMIGFARNKEDAMVIEFMRRNDEEKTLNYWPTKTEEISAWNLAQKGLSRPIPKIFQNGLYDLNRLIWAKMSVAMPRKDTMLRHYSLFPEMRKDLGFLASIYCNEGSWKLLYGKGQGESLKKDV